MIIINFLIIICKIFYKIIFGNQKFLYNNTFLIRKAKDQTGIPFLLKHYKNKIFKKFFIDTFLEKKIKFCENSFYK